MITLTIVGVIAALTIPTLVKKYSDYANYVALKKNYSVLSNAYGQIEREYGKIDEWGFKDHDVVVLAAALKRFEPYMKINKKCVNKAGCWAPVTTKALNEKSNALFASDGIMGVDFISLVLEDGSTLTFDGYNNTRTFPGYFGVNVTTGPYMIIWADVNGYKGPNVVGRDVFGFTVTRQGFFPAGVDDYSNCNKEFGVGYAGFACAYRALKEGGINY